MNYTKATSDNYEQQQELIRKIQSNKSDIKSKIHLFLQYENLLKKICNNLSNNYRYSPLQFEDYFQFATFRFFERTVEYDFESQMMFPNYIKTFVTMDLNNYANKFSTNKFKTLNFAGALFDDVLETKQELNISIEDIDISILNPKQLMIFNSIIKNEGDIKKVSKELNISAKTIYRHRQIIIEKLNIQNNID